MPIYPMDAPKKNGLKKYRVAVSYTDKNGEYKQVFRVAYGKDAAAELERKLIEECKNASPTARMTVADLIDKYLAAKKQDVRQTSWTKSEHVLRLHVMPIVGTLRLDRISAQTLSEWKSSVAALDFSLVTKKGIFREFSALLNWAVRHEYISSNPLKQIGNFRDAYSAAPAEQLHYYTPDQFVRFIRAAADDASMRSDWRYYTFFMIAFFGGLRKGEINALKWSDIDFDHAVLHVRRSITQKLHGVDVETPPKNKSSYRDLQIPHSLLVALRDQQHRQQSDPGYTDDYRVTGGSSVLRDSSIDNKNKAYAAAANLPHIRIHDFRHSHASLLANEGINIQEIARRLGHSNVEITWNTYAHLYPREEERAVSVLDRICIHDPTIGTQEKQEKNKKKSRIKKQA